MASSPPAQDHLLKEFKDSRYFQQYQKDLAWKAKEVIEHEWSQNKSCLKADSKNEHYSYIPLLFKRQQHDVNPDAYAEADFDNLLKTPEERVILVGSPGMGKTVAVLNSLHEWAEDKTRCFDYVFYYNLTSQSDISGTLSLRSLLFDKYCHPVEGADEVFQDILQNSDRVAVIFDGVTERVAVSETASRGNAEVDVCSLMKSILVKELLPNAKIIVTCRSESRNILSSMRCWEKSLTVDVRGFGESSIHEFFQSSLGDEFADELKFILSKSELLSLCHVPMYASILRAFVSSACPKLVHLPETVTAMYLQIFLQCIERHSERGGEPKMDLKKPFMGNREGILSLASASFDEMMRTGDLSRDTSIGSPLQQAILRLDRRDESFNSFYVFLHSQQPFWAALWLLERPEKIPEVLDHCTLNSEHHLKQIVPFLCGLLSGRNATLLSKLFPGCKIKEISDKYLPLAVNTFLPSRSQIKQGDPEHILWACQCLHESQSQDACLNFLAAVQYEINVYGMHLSPLHCCALFYVINQSGQRKVSLIMGKCTISDIGIKMLLHSFPNIQSIREHQYSDVQPSNLSLELWCTALQSGAEAVVLGLLKLWGNKMHLPASRLCDKDAYERAGGVMRNIQNKIKLCIHWNLDRDKWDECLTKAIVDSVPNIDTISFCAWTGGSSALNLSKNLPGLKEGPTDRTKQSVIEFLLDLHVKVVESDTGTRENHIVLLPTMLSFEGFPFLTNYSSSGEKANFLLTLYGHARRYEARTEKTLTGLWQMYKHASVSSWVIDLTQSKALHLLDVLTMQAERKPVELKDFSDVESDLNDFIQCLPYISKLSFTSNRVDEGFSNEKKERVLDFLLKLSKHVFSKETPGTLPGEKYSLMLSSACGHQSFPFSQSANIVKEQSEFLLDFYSKMKDNQVLTGSPVVPLLKTIYKAAPQTWSVDLSKTDTGLFLEVLNLQGVKKPWNLLGWSDAKDSVASIIKCLPFTSHMRLLDFRTKITDRKTFTRIVQFLINLHLQVADHDIQTSENLLQLVPNIGQLIMLTPTFQNLEKLRIEFLMHLYRHMLAYEAKFGRNVSIALQAVFQIPSRLVLDLSHTPSCSLSPTVSNISILLELLKLQSSKRAVQLEGWPTKESDIKMFLHCLQYISKLSLSVAASSENQFNVPNPGEHLKRTFLDARKKGAIMFLIELCLQAAELDTRTGSDHLQLLLSVWMSRNFPLCEDFYKKAQSEFLFDFYLTAKNVEAETGKRVLPLLKSVLQTAPGVWVMDFSETKASLLLEVFKLQASKKAVQIRGWTDDEGEMTSFLMCLPYISQISFGQRHFNEAQENDWEKNMTRFFFKLLTLADQLETPGGDKASKMLVSVCNSNCFPFGVKALIEPRRTKEEFLFGLYSCSKETLLQTKNALPVIQPILQCSPEAWHVDISRGDAVNIFECLKIQTEKKVIVLTGVPGDRSNQIGLLECLPHVSHLRFSRWTNYGEMSSDSEKAISFLISMCLLVAEDGAQPTQTALSAIFQRSKLPFGINSSDSCSFLLDLHQRAKTYEVETGSSVLPVLQPIYSAGQRIWMVDLAQQKASNLLDVLKKQTTKATVQLTKWSEEQSELRTFLKCMSFISHLRISPVCHFNLQKQPCAPRFLINLFALASDCPASTEMANLSSACSSPTFPFDHKHVHEQSNFLLDLYTEAKSYEAQNGKTLLPALWPVFQAAPERWLINLTERPASIFLEVLRFQEMKKPVTILGWTDEESQLKDFIQCLPYISKLSIAPVCNNLENAITFFINLFRLAALANVGTLENPLDLLQSACKFSSFPVTGFNGSDSKPRANQCGFLLTLYSQVSQCEIASDWRVMTALHTVFQVAPELWVVDLAKTKASLLLEVLKLQIHPRRVELLGWSDDERELRYLLRCLPFISTLKVYYKPDQKHKRDKWKETATLMLTLAIEAVKNPAETEEGALERLQSVFSVTEFYHDDYEELSNNLTQTDFLFSLYSDVKKRSPDIFMSVLPVLQPIFIAAPRVWILNLALKKVSIFLEILKFQSDRRPLCLTGWSERENNLNTFVMCLPYISQVICEAEFIPTVASSLPEQAADSQRVQAGVVEALDFTLTAEGELTESRCQDVARVLRLCHNKGRISLAPQKISLTGAHHLFKNQVGFRELCMNTKMTIEAAKWADSESGNHSPLTVEELVISWSPVKKDRMSGSLRALFKQVKGCCSGEPCQLDSGSGALEAVQTLLRCWSVQSLDLRCCRIEGLYLIPLLQFGGPLKIRLNAGSLQQLAVVVCEAQEETLTQSFLEKVDGDLTSCQLDWHVLHHMLLHTSRRIKVDFSHGGLPETQVKEMLPLLERILMPRLCSSLTMLFLKHIFEAGDPRYVYTLTTALGSCVYLDGCVLSPGDCEALRYALSHMNGIHLSLQWASISNTSLIGILMMLNRVSQLR